MGPLLSFGSGEVGLSDLLHPIVAPKTVRSAAITSRLCMWSLMKVKGRGHHVQELRLEHMSTAVRPWTRFYPPGTDTDLGPLKYPHIPAAIRDASARYAKQPAFTLGLPNGSQGSITFEEVDRLSDQFAVYLR